ncbi:MAG: S8 family serine peptidase [Syntrophaceae bacterium]|nr:S8 family serine peptidase [Syntrophaceae bacterium]
MKTFKYIIKIFLFAVIVVGFCSPAFAFQATKAIPGQYIVVLKADKVAPVIKDKAVEKNRDKKVNQAKADRQKVKNKVKAHQAKNNIKGSAILAEFEDVIAGYSAKLNPAEVKKLQEDADVEGVYQDFEVNLGPIPAEMATPQDFTAQSYVTCAVGRAGGPVNSTGKSTWIWILDTGIDLNHPDLNVKTAFAQSFITGQSAEDGHGHGTHCAGIAAAKMNTIGPTGVSAGAWVVPVKVLSNSGSGSFTSVINGLNWVARYDIPGDVVSMSLGAYPVSNCAVANSALRTAIYNLTRPWATSGTYVVMATGNNGNCNGAAYCLPGCINMARTYTVGALDCNMKRASYSNYKVGTVDWVAVGTGVWSTYKNGGYATMSGTSMATPVVAGVTHARGGAPRNGGNVNTGCGTYPSAHR